MTKELTDSQRRYFKSRIDFKNYRYWVKGLPAFKTKKLVLEALRLGHVVSVKSKTSSLFYTIQASDSL